jgi:L-iditol 2-dehydrogenase
MKIAAMFADGSGGIVDRPDPKAVDDFVVVKIRSAPMCTEYKGFKGKQDQDRAGFGHEAAGEVVEVAQPGRVTVGDRVVVQPQYGCGACWLCLDGESIHCQNGRRLPEGQSASATYAQYIVKPHWLLSPFSEDISFDHAGMACCGLGPTFGAMQQMNVNALDTVLITGMGPVGLGGVINGHYRRAKVIAVESQPYRAKLAKELGSIAVLDPNDDDNLEKIKDLTNGLGVDKAIDCSGAAAAHRLMIDALRRKGQACFVGEGGDFPLGASRDMIRKGIVLRGNWHYKLSDFPALIKVINEVGDQLDKFITHQFGMSQVQEAWELQTTGNTGKVVLDPWV